MIPPRQNRRRKRNPGQDSHDPGRGIKRRRHPEETPEQKEAACKRPHPVIETPFKNFVQTDRFPVEEKRHPEFRHHPGRQEKYRKRSQHVKPVSGHFPRQRQKIDRAEARHHDRKPDREIPHPPSCEKILPRVLRTSSVPPADPEQNHKIERHYKIIDRAHLPPLSRFGSSAVVLLTYFKGCPLSNRIVPVSVVG